MSKFMVVSDGDKMKVIREKYKLKQEEISGGDITRNLISEIETNRAPITKNTAEIIIKNLNKLARKKHFEVTETVEYLMENEIIQAKKIFDEYINELKTFMICKDNSFIKTLKQAEEFLIDWDIKDKKIEIYELAGDYFCNQNDFYRSSMYYEKANALVNKAEFSKELLNILRKLSMVYFYTEKYEESIECFEFANQYFTNIDNETKAIFFYNSAICYKKLGNFNRALNNFCETEKLVDKSSGNKYFEILIEKATCFHLMKNYSKALEVYNEILESVNNDDTEKHLIILVNRINTYIQIKENNKVRENLEIILEEIKNINSKFSYIADVYFEIGNIFEYLGNLNKTKEFYLNSLDLAEKNKNYFLIENILISLTDVCKETNDDKEINNIKNSFLRIAAKKEKVNQKLLYKLVGFYLEAKDIESLKQIYNFTYKYIK